MKKLFALVVTLILVIGSFSLTAFAKPALLADVYVTISDKDGKLALTQEKITVTDTDNDDLLTIYDALYIAHEENFAGGAAAGFEAADLGYSGRSIKKLWGVENGGSYGIYVNNAGALSLDDTIESGDYINTFIYTDLTAWSDKYSFFNVNTVDTDAGKEIELTLYAADYDANWTPITVAVEGAEITLNGEKTGIKTDENGKASITVNNAGFYTISAVSDTLTLVSPVCKATITGSVVSGQTDKAETTTPAVTSPKTNDSINLSLLFILALTSLFGIILLLFVRNKMYEK
ncbi:MAG: hypothetical protein II802_01490 [Clostridia bacterium]|nr:hypothetical protein [Clostridia bacterium]